MAREIVISLGANDNGRVVTSGEYIDENEKSEQALFALSYRVADRESNEPLTVDVRIFLKKDILVKNEESLVDDEKEIAVETIWKKFQNSMFKSWTNGDDDDFSDMFTADSISFTWDISENQEPPLNFKLKNVTNITRKNRIVVEQYFSKKLAAPLLSEIEKLELEVGMNSYSKEFLEKAKSFRREIRELSENESQNRLHQRHANTLKNIISEIFDKLDDMKKVVQEENYSLLSPKVEEAVKRSRTSEEFKESWSFLRSVQDDFKGKTLEKEAHDALWEMLQDSFETLKKRQTAFFDKLDILRKENYEKLQPEVEECIKVATDAERFKDAWTKLRSVQSMFKGVKMVKEQHDELWSKLQEAFETLKFRESEYYEEKEKEWSENYETLNSKVDEALKVAESAEHFKDSWEKLKAVQAEFKGVKMKREQHDQVWEKMQTAFETLKRRQEEKRLSFDTDCEENFSRLDRLCNRATNEAKTNKSFNDVFTKLKDWQKEIFETKPLKREQRGLLIDRINEAFALLKERQDSYFDEKKEMWQSKQEDFLKKMELKKEHLQNVLLKMEEEKRGAAESGDADMENIELQLKELNEKISEIDTTINEITLKLENKD